MSPQPFHLPWLRLSLLIRSILGTSWDEETWPTVKTTLARALRIRASLVREGWFNWSREPASPHHHMRNGPDRRMGRGDGASRGVRLVRARGAGAGVILDGH